MHNIVNQLLYGTVVPTLCKNICADRVIISVTSKLGLWLKCGYMDLVSKYLHSLG